MEHKISSNEIRLHMLWQKERTLVPIVLCNIMVSMDMRYVKNSDFLILIGSSLYSVCYLEELINKISTLSYH